jgi:hypothetical protein
MDRRKRQGEWVNVQSSAVREVRYRAREKKLDLIYSDEDCTYEYYDVPRSKFRALMQADSKGQFVNKEIKPKYPYRKLAPNKS